ncbi:hypothetical protein D3870_13185 [Noviherbaspirillum cavernae]|uniref:Uncharacterized protein n=2 Tax=Noviherbaspirillum cavernae TaxID=2320862 RepID=A0A418X306_9BURK|nr:hypothetical protein D3870_13185 [Noviherbaspirillum cavernae]
MPVFRSDMTDQYQHRPVRPVLFFVGGKNADGLWNSGIGLLSSVERDVYTGFDIRSGIAAS